MVKSGRHVCFFDRFARGEPIASVIGLDGVHMQPVWYKLCPISYNWFVCIRHNGFRSFVNTLDLGVFKYLKVRAEYNFSHCGERHCCGWTIGHFGSVFYRILSPGHNRLQSVQLFLRNCMFSETVNGYCPSAIMGEEE